MRVIGITGGVGAGKTKVLNYIRKHYNCSIIFADEVGNIVKEKGKPCYQKLVELLGKGILDDNGEINRNKMAECLFRDDDIREKVNAIIHPAVTDYILSQIKEEKQKRKLDFFFVEAALLIECGYKQYLDEIWYIYADKETRKKRLIQERQYSEDKINGIMKGQLSEHEFMENCDATINNSNDFAKTIEQIDEKLGDISWKMQVNTQDN